MTEPIRQHHVPQTYLQNFSFKRKEESRLYCWDKTTNKVFPANVEDVAVEKNFYTVKKHDNIYAWENFYAESIEPLMRETISEIMKHSANCLIMDKAKVINTEQKGKLAIIMVCQLLRGKHGREYMYGIFKTKALQILDDAKKKFMGKGNEQIDIALENYKLDDELFKIVAMESTLDIERITKFVQILVNRCWIVFNITGNAQFVTSDNPFMFMNKDTFNVTPFHNGLIDSNTVTYFPISSKLMIATYNSDLYLGMLNSYDCKLVFIDGNRESRFINSINKKQMEQCNRQAFAKSKELLEQLK